MTIKYKKETIEALTTGYSPLLRVLCETLVPTGQKGWLNERATLEDVDPDKRLEKKQLLT